MQCTAAASVALRAPLVCRQQQGIRSLPVRPALKVRGWAEQPIAVPMGFWRAPEPASLRPTAGPPALQAVGLRSSSFAGLRLEQQVATVQCQRRTAVISAAAEAEVQLDPLERWAVGRGSRQPCRASELACGQ